MKWTTEKKTSASIMALGFGLLSILVGISVIATSNTYVGANYFFGAMWSAPFAILALVVESIATKMHGGTVFGLVVFSIVAVPMTYCALMATMLIVD